MSRESWSLVAEGLRNRKPDVWGLSVLRVVEGSSGDVVIVNRRSRNRYQNRRLSEQGILNRRFGDQDSQKSILGRRGLGNRKPEIWRLSLSVVESRQFRDIRNRKPEVEVGLSRG